jgi:hypothetical protein
MAPLSSTGSMIPRARARLCVSGLLLGCLLALLSVGTAAAAPSSHLTTATASGGKISAHLTKTRFTPAQAGKVKLIYSFSKPSKSFSYLLTFKKGTKWQTVKRVKKQGYFKGSHAMTVKKVFAGKPVKVGSYRLKLSADGGRKLLSFKVVKATPTATPTPTGSKPANTALPTISGTTTQGQTLSASNGSWSNSPNSYTRQWRRCDSAGASCSDISGATSSSYILVLADIGSTFRVVVTASNSYGSASATSSQTTAVAGLPPANTALPTISGTTTQGETLSASSGSWSNSPTSYAYQWRRCDNSGTSCSDISSASSSSYTLAYADVGSTIRVVVTASNPYGSASATSSQTAVVASLATPEVGALAALANAATVGQAEEDIRLFFAYYNMTVAITNIQPSWYAQTWATWAPVGGGDLPALKAYGAALINEWGKYPLDWVRVTRVSGVVLVDQLAVSGTPRAAMPDVGGDVMFYDIGYGSGDYAREGIHHEFDHLLTYNLFGSYAPSDPTWLSLNPLDFHYGNGGASCYVPGDTCLTGPHPIPGFVSGYAASAIEEDKAETYGYLMETNDYWLLKGWIGSDSYLTAKVTNYEDFLCSLSAAMCGGYFDAINRR